MKKIICMLLACVLCVTALGGCQGQKEPITEDDFKYYNENGQIQNFKEEDKVHTVSKGEKIAGKTLQTKRGVKLGDPMSVIAEKYDLSVIYTGYYYEKPNLNVKELKELNDSFPTAEDAFNHLDEIKAKVDNEETDYITFTCCLLDSGEFIELENLNDRSGYGMGFRMIPKDGDFIITEIILERYESK